MLNLLRFKTKAASHEGESGEQAHMRDGREMREFVESRGGRFIWAGPIGCQPLPTPGLPADAPELTDVPHPATSDDGPVVVLHVLRFVEGHGIGHMTSYQEVAGRVAIPHGVRISGWFSVEGTIIGDGQPWDQVRFNAFPSKAAFMAVTTDPDRLRAQRAHREIAIDDTYTMIFRPKIDRLAESVKA
jgi:hypothetical protein